jgi:hypothetical protein
MSKTLEALRRSALIPLIAGMSLLATPASGQT